MALTADCADVRQLQNHLQTEHTRTARRRWFGNVGTGWSILSDVSWQIKQVVKVVKTKRSYRCRTWKVQSYSPGGTNVHTYIHTSLNLSESTSQMTSRSVHSFLQGSRSWQTDRQTTLLCLEQ